MDVLGTVLSVLAVSASIFWFCHRLWREKQDREKLEQHLAGEKRMQRVADDTGKRTMNHLMRELGMSQDRILYLSTKSKMILRTSKERKDGMSGEVMFEHIGDEK